MTLQRIIIVAAFAILLVGGVFLYFSRTRPRPAGEGESPKVMSERITLTTSDGKTIVGDYSGESGKPAVLMLHMMPAARGSWRQFSEKLNTAGFQTLAIDLRGHGESSGGPNGYKKFSDEEHQASIRDTEAGVDFLKTKNTPKLFIAGASIGANLALWYAAEHADISGVILLSPGLDYRGIKTEKFAEKLRNGQAVHYAASGEDTYSADSMGKLFAATPSEIRKEFKMFDKAGHGTTIFENEPAFMDELVEWLKKI